MLNFLFGVRGFYSPLFFLKKVGTARFGFYFYKVNECSLLNCDFVQRRWAYEYIVGYFLFLKNTVGGLDEECKW